MHSGPIVDCDIHHDWPSHDALLPYLSAGWREYATRSGGRQPMPVIPTEIHPNPGGVFRDDAWPQEGGPPGSSHALREEQPLDRCGVERGLGHPLFHPIYQAAEELGLPIAIHAAGESFASMRVSPAGSGVPGLYLEHHTLIPQGITTQPLEIAPSRRHMLQLLKLIGAEDILCFSSDYPLGHDDIADVGRSIPEPWHRKVFYDNVMGLFGWNG